MAPLDRIRRNLVQRIKEARRISVIVNDKELQIDFPSEPGDIKKLSHDIAIAIQDYFIKH